MLSLETFEFVLNNELKRAMRSQNFLTLVLVKPALRGVPGGTIAEHDKTIADVARVLSREVRETDLIARTHAGQLSVVLLDSDLQSSLRAIDRMLAGLYRYTFPRPLAFEVSTACCPTHGADVESLKRAAEVRPVRQQRDQSNARS